MTKEEAIQAMKEGKKVTHPYFSKDEWLTMDGNKIYLEDGCSCWSYDFWVNRKGFGWDNGYSLYPVIDLAGVFFCQKIRGRIN